MDLWTDFEGVTIDGSFPLKRLLETEGRSAFFSTQNEKGESILIRIIECHFDEDEIQARWRGVKTLGHPNLLRIDRFGQFLIEADDITAVYVTFERVDENLAEVLERGHLSTADAVQIGVSVASAIEALHANGFVHEHVEPRNIFAVGETVKLRGDCIRETPEGEAGVEARRGDAKSLAVVLAQVLLGGNRPISALQQRTLPAPFDEIVRRGMSGEWGLAEMQRALAGNPAPASKVYPANAIEAREVRGAVEAALPRDSASKRDAAHARLKRGLLELPVIFGPSHGDFRRWMAATALFLGAILLGWILIHDEFSGRAEAAAPTAAAAQGWGTAAGDGHANASLPSPARAARQSRSVWRVVAFTYQRRDQAAKKASLLEKKEPGLEPEVFSPSGRGPWLVTIGGALKRDAAYALARRARSLGLPRDTYAQNYTAR